MNSKLLRSSTRLPQKSSDDFTIFQEPHKRNTNIKVVGRFRPLIEIEKEFGEESLVQLSFPNENTVLIPQGNNYEHYTCDRMFTSSSTQEQVYDFIGYPTVSDVLEGYNGTIFAYGQTGSGKTYTMMGNLYNNSNCGIIPRAISHIFRSASVSPLDIEFTLKCSMLEIYKEKLRDLLGISPQLKIKECPRRGVYVEGITEIFVASEAELTDVIESGEKSRTVASTRMNSASSRSHQLFTIEIRQKFPNDTEKKGVLNLIDLAGSEKIKDTCVTGINLEETKKINLSLSALGNVIHALTSMSDHIPYRDSKLTRLLQESLGGNYKTALIITCSPSSRNIEETINTLKFAQRAKKIKTTAKINIKNNSDSYIKIIEDLK